MSSSLMARMVAMSCFCVLLSFLIASPLPRRRGASRNDSRGLLAILLQRCVNNKEHCVQTGRSHRDPAYVVACRIVVLRQGARIVKDKRRSLEANPMLQQILAVFLVVPFEAHGRFPRRIGLRIREVIPQCQYICTYTIRESVRRVLGGQLVQFLCRRIQ